jgi:signal transduction histidine kinase
MTRACILVVEDEGLVALDIKTTLERLGYAVPALASTGSEAIRVAGEVRLDLALMDIILKDSTDGIEVASVLREQYDVPVVYLTAYTNEEMLQRAATTVPYGYMLKPFEERELQKTVAMALHLHRLERAERQQRALADALKDTAAALTDTLDLEEVLDRILAQVGRIVEHDRANIMLINGEMAHIKRYTGQVPHTRDYRISDLSGLSRMVAGDAPVVTADTETDGQWVTLNDGFATRSYVGAPIRIKGQLIGFLNLNSATPNRYAAADAQRLQAFADQAAVAIENARLYAQTLRINAELQDALRIKEEIVQNVAHDLRAPLAQIHGFAEALSDGVYGKLTTEQREIAGIIAQRSRASAHLVDGFMALKAFPARGLHLESIDVELLLIDAAEAWRPLLSKLLTLEVRPPAADITVLADQYPLREALDQLIGNAIKFTPEGGTIQLAAQAGPGWVRLAVSDTGSGIPAADLEQVFERFYRGQHSGADHEGMGIGLAIVRKIVEAHGGRTWAESPGSLGRGTTFYIELAGADDQPAM